MSWSLSVPASTASEFDGNAREALTKYLETVTLDSDAIDQAEMVIAAAAALLASGVIGADDKHFSVSLSGHSNPGHAPKDGWSNDCCSISVSQVAAPSESTG